MKTAIFFVAIVFCLPLWAEEVDPFADLPVTFGIEYGSRASYFRVDEQIFHFRATHNGEFVSQIDIDLAVFSPGEQCLNDNWTGGITARYLHSPRETNGLIGQRPEPARMYFQFHHITKRLEARIYIPLMYKVENQQVMPWIELERLTLLELDKTTLYLRGWCELGETPNLDLGVSRILFGSVEFKAYTDLLKPGTDFGFSVGVKLTANR